MSEEVKTTEETLYCECCGCLIDDDDYTEWNGQIICSDCLENHTTTCECCGERIWDEDVYGDNNITLCSHCYHHSYTRCSCCDALLHEDDAYYLDGETYCRDCYEDEREESNLIHEYGYKPNPIFYGEGNRYFGIELEIDGAGRDDDFAEELLDIANPTPTCFTSRQTARWTMAWNWFRTLALWTITSTSFHGRISCTVPFVKATVRTRLQPVVCISM